MSKRIVAALLVACVGAWLSAPAPADLIQNGGFQDSNGVPSGAGWYSYNTNFQAGSYSIFQQDSTPFVWFNTGVGNLTGAVWQEVTVDSAGTGTLTALAFGRSDTNDYSSSSAGTPFMDLYAGAITDLSSFVSATPITANPSYMPALSESPQTFSKTYDSLAAGTYTVLVRGLSAGGIYQSAYDNVSFNVATPEPSALVLVVTGLIGLLCYAWRKRR